MKEVSYVNEMAKKYHVDDDNVINVALSSVSVNSLNEWLKKISLNDEIDECNNEIEKLLQEINDLNDKYIRPIQNKIEEKQNKIQEIRNSPPDLNKRSEKISKIIQEAINQNPNLIASNAKQLLIGKYSDFSVDINKISALTKTDKEELYKMYLDEFRKLAGLQ